MITKNEIKYIQSLSFKKQRDIENVFVVEGVKLVDEFLKSNFIVNKVYATIEWVQKNPEIQASLVTDDELKKISNLITPNKVLAVVQNKAADVLINNKYTGWILCLDGIQDPGNLGSIIRIADWFGIKHIVCSKQTADWRNSKVLQSTMGSILRVNLVYTQLEEWLKNTNKPIFTAVLNGENMHEILFPNEGILVIGNEGNGISKIILNMNTKPISIPQFGNAESLNAAVATGILVSHIIK
ncbi:MAG: TrmH family RNA methyltransferase [Chitinophagaceae bacterium]